MSGFNFDKNAWDKVAKKAVNKVQGDTQASLDRFFARYQGKPLTTVKPALRSEWRRLGIKGTEAELTGWAQQVSEGRRIVFRQR